MNWGLIMAGVLLGMLVTLIVAVVAARRWPETRTWAIVLGLAAAAVPVAIVLHNVLSAVIGGEEAVSFIVALAVAPLLFTIGTLGLGVALARERARRELGASLIVAGTGAALWCSAMVLSLAVTSVTRSQPDWLIATSDVLIPTGVLALVGGAIGAALALLPRPGVFASRA